MKKKIILKIFQAESNGGHLDLGLIVLVDIHLYVNFNTRSNIIIKS